MDFYRHNIKITFDITEVVTIHYFKYTKSFSTSGEVHDFFELVYVDSGNVEIVDGKKRINLSQGECYMHKKNVFHSIKAKDTYSNIIIFTFDGTKIEKLKIFDRVLLAPQFSKVLISHIVSIAPNIFSDPLNIVDQTKMTLKKGGKKYFPRLKACLQLLIITLLEENESHEKPENALSKKITKFLEDNIRRQVTLEEVAKHIGYSVPFLKKLSKNEFDCGIIQYHLWLKIEKAKLLIAENQMNFAQISDYLDFASAQYFSTTFRKQTNMSPSDYKNSVMHTNLL